MPTETKPTLVISVARDGQELGSYYLEGIKDGLTSGYFRVNDYGWYDGLPEWVYLSEIVAQLESRSQQHPVLPHVKQHLKPHNGTVKYILADAKNTSPEESPKRRKKLIQIKEVLFRTWENESATDKQLAFLYQLGVRQIPQNFTKGCAHDMIENLLDHEHGFLSPKQRACLVYHKFDPEKLDYTEARALLNKIHENPDLFDVPEPWETAKYRLYPELYPSPQKPFFGRLVLFILAMIIIIYLICR